MGRYRGSRGIKDPGQSLRRTICLLLIGLAALLVLVAACGQNSSGPAGSNAGGDSPAIAAAVANGWPSPDGSRLPSSAYTENMLWGGNWADYMPSNLVSNQDGWAELAPQAAAQPAGLAGLAFATYVFSIKHPTSPRLRLDLKWDGPPPPGNSYYIALANWEQRRWEWHSVYAPFKFGLPSSSAYLYPGTDDTEYLAVVIAVRGTQPATLSYVVLGAYSNTLPVPVVFWTCGDPANEVQLSATQSYDQDGVIKHYLWDFDGDSAFDAQGPSVVHTFAPSTSAVPVVLRVYDDDNQYAELTTDVQPINWEHQPLYLNTGNLARAVMDSSGRLHFAYLALDHATVMYALYDNGQWLLEPVHFHSAALDSSQIEIALLPDGEPGLAYIAREAGSAAPESQVYFARRTAGVWQHELVDEPVNGVLGLASLGMALNAAGETLLAYGSESAPGQSCISLAQHTAGSWAVAPATDLNWAVQNVALALDAEDDPLLAVSGDAPDDDWPYTQAELYRWNGSGWDRDSVVQMFNLQVQSVTVTPENEPLVLVGLGAPLVGVSLMYMVPLGDELSLYNAGVNVERSLLVRGGAGQTASLCAGAYSGAGMTFTEISTAQQIPLRNYILCDKQSGAAVGAGYDSSGAAWAVYRSNDGYVLARQQP